MARADEFGERAIGFLEDVTEAFERGSVAETVAGFDERQWVVGVEVVLEDLRDMADPASECRIAEEFHHRSRGLGNHDLALVPPFGSQSPAEKLVSNVMDEVLVAGDALESLA